jgi:hypothetical protein
MTYLLDRDRLDELLDEEVNRGRRRERIFRDRINPLDQYDDVELYHRFRFRREGILELTEMLKPDLEHKTLRNYAVPPVLQASALFRAHFVLFLWPFA